MGDEDELEGERDSSLPQHREMHMDEGGSADDGVGDTARAGAGAGAGIEATATVTATTTATPTSATDAIATAAADTAVLGSGGAADAVPLEQDTGSSPDMQGQFYQQQPQEQPHDHHHQQQQQQQHHHHDQHLHSPSAADFRASLASPHPTNGALPSTMSLPPIQHFEGQSMQGQPQYVSHQPSQQQQHQQHQHQSQHQQHNMNGAQPPPVGHIQPSQYAPAQYPYQNGTMAPTMPSNTANGVLRYPLPPQATLDARQISGQGRHKKEIKRRTKTGCLTCRKRRIKCDEGHPTCRNCQKSKRECLGYDPIFKQQPGPAPIQPAPIATTATPSSMKVGATPTLQNNPYPTYTNAVGVPSYLAQPPPPPNQQAPQPGDHHFAYNTSLDPALTGSDQAGPDLSHEQYPSRLEAARRVRPLSIDRLFSLNDIHPPFYPGDISSPTGSFQQRDILEFYDFHYAPGLDKLLETSWYSSRGPSQLVCDARLRDFVSRCMEQFKLHGSDDTMAKAIFSLEASLVWQLALMPRGSAQDPLQQELLPRIDVLEHLLTGHYLDESRLPPSSTPGFEPPQSPKARELSFWHELGRFVSLHDETGAISVQDDVDDALSVLRSILSLLENRDVLYSIAVARHIGGRMLDWDPQHNLPAHLSDPTSEAGKLHVAHNFVQNEDARGTNQVIQRVCGMALRGWVLQKRPEQ